MSDTQEKTRQSINVWTSSRCQNSALEDDHGKAFYDNKQDSVNSPIVFTPRRSARIRPMPEYPRERSTGDRQKRRRNRNKRQDRATDKSPIPFVKLTPPTPDKDAGLIKVKSPNEIHKITPPTRPIAFVSPIVDSEKKISPKKSCAKKPPKTSNKTKFLTKNNNENISPIIKPKKRTPIRSTLAELFSLKDRNTPKTIPKAIPIGLGKSASSQKKILSSNRRNQTPLKRKSGTPTKPSTKKSINKATAVVKPQTNNLPIKSFQFTPDVLTINLITPPITEFTSDSASSVTKKLRKRIDISKIPVFARKGNNAEKSPKLVQFHETGTAQVRLDNKAGYKRQEKTRALYKAGFIKSQQREIIQGVRSNRRFELQMQYRDEFLRT